MLNVNGVPTEPVMVEDVTLGVGVGRTGGLELKSEFEKV
jgi:hypothetical protein